MTADTFADDFEELLNAKNSAWEVPLEAYLEEYSKRLQGVLAADNGFSKMNFSEPAFIVSKAAKVWGKKVDNLDDFLHTVLKRVVATNNSDSVINIDDINPDESISQIQPENLPKKQRQRTAGWTLEDLRSPKDIFRSVIPTESESIDISKNQSEVDARNTLRPRINFDLHPVYRLPVSISIKNIHGDALGDYCDFFCNTFDVDQVTHLLDNQLANVDRTLEMMDIAFDEDAEDTDLFCEPVTVDDEPVKNLCPNILSEEAQENNLSAEAVNSEFPFANEQHAISNIESQPALWNSQSTMVNPSQEILQSGLSVRRPEGKRTITNKFLVRLDPYDDSQEAKRRKPLPNNPGKPYKLPSQKQKDSVPLPIKTILSSKSGDLLSELMPPLKPPAQIPSSVADSVNIEFSEVMSKKLNDVVLEACGRKSHGSRLRDALTETEVAEAIREESEIPFTQEMPEAYGEAIVAHGSDDEDNGGDLMPTESDGFVFNSSSDVLPGVQSLEEMIPDNVCDESRIRRLQEWDRYVEQRIEKGERIPFDVNDYCSRMVSYGQKTGKKKWFSLEQVAAKLAGEKNNEADDSAKRSLNIRREGARSLVSLLFLANKGNIEFRSMTLDNIGKVEIRLMNDSIERVDMTGEGAEVPNRVVLASH